MKRFRLPTLKVEEKEQHIISLSKGDLWVLVQIGLSLMALMGLLVLILKVSSMWIEFVLFLLVVPLSAWLVMLCMFIAIDKLRDDLGKITIKGLFKDRTGE
jgi:hypothetical protein